MPVWAAAVVGGGIVGLSTARELQRRLREPVVVLEAEAQVAAHQSGHNSGVVHAGLYYAPGSLRATLTRRSVGLLREYCQEHGLGYRADGKVVVATAEHERAALERIFARAHANGVPGVELVGRLRLGELEPHVRGVAGVYSPHTAVVDYAAVARQLAADVLAGGGQVCTGAAVREFEAHPDGVRLRIGAQPDPSSPTESDHELDGLVARRVVIAAGLHSDRLARAAGAPSEPTIVPVRGEYLRLRPESGHLVRSLIYPVPDPRRPFLGVHFTRHIDHSITIGPNAVPALSRHGYSWADVSARDLRDLFLDAGARKFFLRHTPLGIAELTRALVPQLVVRRAQQLIPALQRADISPCGAGVRAQAVAASGQLVDDFVVHQVGAITAIRNAPSPAATASFAIAEHVTDLVLG